MTYLHTPFLILPSIKNVPTWNIEYSYSNFQILKLGCKYYLAIKRNFQNATKKQFNKLIFDNSIQLESIELDLENIVKFGGIYGDENDFIVDMNGIDNFRFAKSLHFYDSMIRGFAKEMNLLSEETTYLRFGAAGSDYHTQHPGGEVFEYQFIKGDTCGGNAQSVSGYFHDESSKSIPLSFDNKVLRDDRAVYSHTAWLKKSDVHDTRSYYFRIKCLQSGQSILDSINVIARYLGISAYAVQLYAQKDEMLGNGDIIVKGRVLKHIPRKAFAKLQEASDIASEKTFKLPNDSRLLAVGTKYDRYEPDWEIFTNGHKYEPRGHLHATIERGERSDDKIYETFHLRDMWGSTDSEIQIVLTPINTIYRIYPIHLKNKVWICNSNNVDINNIIQGIVEYDRK